MLNREKVRLMCQLAVFEKREGRDVFEIGKYYKSDYISKGVFSSAVHYTLCFLLVLAIAVLLRVNDILLLMSIDFMKTVGETVLLVYLGGMAVIMLASGIACAQRYDAARRQKLLYASKLERLLRFDEAAARPESDARRIGMKYGAYRREEAPARPLRGQSRGRKSRRTGE